jgi:topoisomerase IV subunit A
MDDLKQLMKNHFLIYASKVVLDRAIPNVIDGLKPVQRRILHTLWTMNDGKLHKVMNVAGQTMVLHPHGDAPIVDAIVNLANKGFLLDLQGNFGNIFTGDAAAAGRYIETRLSSLALETMFNPDLTEMLPSYDARHLEPSCLPSKIPLLLMQGAEGIAVGMATRILPHNFIELLEAEIAILEERPFTLYPDFLTGGIMDASDYDKGRGKVKLRAKLEVPDAKTIKITEICYGTTTESLIRSIDEAAKKGKIKIDSINDYTAEKVEIEIKLPRGQYAEDLIDALYAYTECEVTLHSQVMTIKDNLPWETDVDEILHLHAAKLKEYLRRELEIERDRLLEKIFEKSLERIFIENRLYKKIEEIKTYPEIHSAIEKSLKPFHEQLSRLPEHDDRERLLNIPIRRITLFDLNKNLDEIKALQSRLDQVLKDLKNIKKFTVNYLNALLKKYGPGLQRKTKIQNIEQIDRRAIETRTIKVGFDPVSGFVGTKVSSNIYFECTNYDKLLLMYQDGTYQVTNIPEKKYVHREENKVVFASVADKETVISVVCKDPKTNLCYGKRFIISKFILDKKYRYFDEGMKLEYLSAAPQIKLMLHFVPKVKQKVKKVEFALDDLLIKGVASKGVRMSNSQVKKITEVAK